MFISEHKINSKTIVMVVLGKERLEFETKIVAVSNDSGKRVVFCDAIRNEGKLITFNNILCHVSIIGEDGRTYVYKTKYLNNVTVNGGKLLAIQCDDSVSPFNKRDAYRYSILSNAVIRPTSHHGTIKGFMRDISQTGIGLSIPNNTTVIPPVGEEISVSFKYDDLPYKMDVIVRRVMEQDNSDFIIIGAELSNYTAPIKQLISKLSMREARLNRRGR